MDKKDKIVMLVSLAILIGFIMAIFQMAYVSAYTTSSFQLDTAKQLELKSETNYGTITLKDRYFVDVFGWFDKDLAKLTLKENTDSCGNDCYAIKDVELFEDGSLVDDVRFYRIYEDGKQELSSIRSYEVLIKTDEKVSIEDVYEYQCKETGKILGNGTAEVLCSNIKTGTKEVVEDIWGKYNLGDKMPKGTYTVKLIGEKRAEWSYDWQILSQGYWTEEWSVWGSGYDVLEESPSLTGLSCSTNNDNYRGVKIISFRDVFLANITRYAGVTATTCDIKINADGGATTGTIVASGTFIGNNCPINYTLISGTSYKIGIHSGGADYTLCSIATSYPYKLDDGLIINATTGWGSGGADSGVWYNLGNLTIVNTVLGSQVTLNSPTNHFNSSSKTITFNVTATVVGGATLKNISLYHNYTGTWVRNKTIAMGGSITTNTSTFPTTFPSDKVFDWRSEACDSDNACGWSENRTLTIDTTAPTINLLYPTGIIPYGYVGQNISLNYSIANTNLKTCWYNYNGTNITTPCTTNASLILTTAKTILFYANDSAGNLNTTSFGWDYTIFENSQTYNNETLEGASETFSVNLTYDSSNTLIPYLIYNNTIYLGSISGSGNNIIVSRIVPIPSVSTATNKTFYWNISIDGTTTQLENYNQTINDLTIDDCSVGTFLLYNFTIKDEETGQTYPSINGTLNVDLSFSSPGTTNEVITYANSFNGTTPKIICSAVNLTSGGYRVDLVADYVAEDHVLEFYYIDNGSINSGNIPQHIDLYDLLTADSTTFLFEYTDENNQKVDNIIVHTFRKYIGEGIFKEIERSKQDNAGQTHIHLVEEDVIYYFMITQDSNILYTSDTYNAKCLSTPCEITLSASPSETNWSLIFNEGSQYSVSADKDTRIVTTRFNLDESALVNMSVYKFYNGNYTFINRSSLTAIAGAISVYVPLTYDNSTFIVLIYNNNVFVKSTWVSLTEDARDYFGTTGAILSGLIVLAMMLMAVSEGAGFIIFTILALIVVGIMQLVDLSWLAIISIICAGGIIIWKLISRRGVRQ